MENIKQTLITKLIAEDNKRDRSVQVNVGPSEIGGCARRLWYRINKVPTTNQNTERLAAIMGTAIHGVIEEAFADTDGYETEVALEAHGITGHVDLLDVKNGIVWDWKTTTLNGLGWFGSQQQLSQVQLYGYLANSNGIVVNKVGLVGIPRDGNENDIVEILVDYDEAVALDALERLNNVATQFEPPRPERDASYCERFCSYFGECAGIATSNADSVIDNPDTVALIDTFKALQADSKALSAKIEFAKAALDGVQGRTTSGVLVKWSQVAGRMTVDEDAIVAVMGSVPKKQGAGYARLTVK